MVDQTITTVTSERIRVGCLLYGAQKGDTELVQYLLDRHVDINGSLGRTGTALFYAVAYQNWDAANILLDNNASPTACQEQGFSCLTVAVAGNNIGIISRLINADPDLQRTLSTRQGRAIAAGPFRLACILGMRDIATLFYQKGYGINIQTVFRSSCRRGLGPMVTQLLIWEHIDANLIVETFETCLRYGVTDVILALMRVPYSFMALCLYEFDIPPENVMLDEISEMSAGQTLPESYSEIHVPLIEFNNLFLACLLGRNDVVHDLIARSMTTGSDFHLDLDVRSRENRSFTALQFAIIGNHSDVVTTLLNAGADVNATSGESHGFITPLMLACSAGNIEIVQKLVEFGADIGIVRVDGMTALHTACQDGPVELVQYMLDSPGIDVDVKNHDEMTPLHLTAERGSVAIMRSLVAKGADVAPINRYKWSPLHFCAFSRNHRGVKLLLEQGALQKFIERCQDMSSILPTYPIMVLSQNAYCSSRRSTRLVPPICSLDASKHVEGQKILDELIAYGTDPAGTDDKGNTAMHTACEGGCLLLIKDLADRVPQLLNVRNRHGFTPIINAVKNVYNQKMPELKLLLIIETLMNNGASIKPVHGLQIDENDFIEPESKLSTVLCGLYEDSPLGLLYILQESCGYVTTTNLDLVIHLGRMCDYKLLQLLLEYGYDLYSLLYSKPTSETPIDEQINQITIASEEAVRITDNLSTPRLENICRAKVRMILAKDAIKRTVLLNRINQLPVSPFTKSFLSFGALHDKRWKYLVNI